jgi:hypothetical protein
MQNSMTFALKVIFFLVVSSGQTSSLKLPVTRFDKILIRFSAGIASATLCNSGVCSSEPWSNVLQPLPVLARSLPESNGASGAYRGQPKSLAPILKMRNAINAALAEAPQDLSKCSQALSSLPSKETEFMKLFDEHSEGISYKQVFTDQNAFLVYYTGGFDGPNRPSIEADDETSLKEKLQFGARNDAWVQVDEARSEVQYLLEQAAKGVNEDRSDLKAALQKAAKAFNDYVALDSPDIVKQAEQML